MYYHHSDAIIKLRAGVSAGSVVSSVFGSY